MGENDEIHFLPFLDTFGYRYKRKKCLETGETEKVSRNGRKRKVSLDMRKQKVCRNNIQICPSELSAEGTKRGVRRFQLPDWSPPDDLF